MRAPLAPRRAPPRHRLVRAAAAAAALLVLSCRGAAADGGAGAGAGAPAAACPDASGVDYASLAARCASDETAGSGAGSSGMSAAACARCVDALGAELVPLFVRAPLPASAPACRAHARTHALTPKPHRVSLHARACS
jgi:hypothetical protein